MHYKNLDERTRAFMVQEVKLDLLSGNLYYSKRFNETGNEIYPPLLLEATKYHDDGWLAEELSTRRCFKAFEEKRSKSGYISRVRTPFTAEETFAEGEFNRFYMRAVCLAALEDGSPTVIVYRGKPVEQARPESEALIGKQISAQELLEDLRHQPGEKSKFGLPSGPNSGITICLQNKELEL